MARVFDENNMEELSDCSTSSDEQSNEEIVDIDGSVDEHCFTFDEVAEIVPIFKCRKCDFVNKEFTVVLAHYKTHEFWSPPPASKNKMILICSLCNAFYKDLNSIKTHMIVDHGCGPKNDSRRPREINCVPNETRAPAKEAAPITLPKEYTVPIERNQESKDESKEDILSPDNITPVPFREFKSILKRPLTSKCPIKGCCYKFETKEKLEKHLKCHISTDADRNQEFQCIECKKELKPWRNCTDHMWKLHKIDLDMLSCPVCPHKFHTAVRVWRHMMTHPKWRSKYLKSHWHPSKAPSNATENRWYTQKTCRICSRRFKNSKTLSKHVKTVHNRIKPFICNVCGRKSARKATWIIHMRQHTGEKPLQCKFCAYKASDPSVLSSHEKRHSQNTKYKCNLCNYSSIQSGAFKHHMKSNHPEEFKELSCDQCRYVSVSKVMLEAHKKDHKTGLILNEDSMDPARTLDTKPQAKHNLPGKNLPTAEISSDCFLPLESTDSIAPDPSVDTGGVTIPAPPSEETQFPSFIEK